MRKSILFNEDGTLNEDLIPENTNKAVGNKYELGICPICGENITFRVKEIKHFNNNNILIKFILGCSKDNKWSKIHNILICYDKNGNITVAKDERQIAVEEFNAAISEMFVEKLNLMIKRYEKGIDVVYEGYDEQDGIYCPNCKEMIARNDDEFKPKHCPECGVKLIY